MIYTIYRATNTINNKVYIGFTKHSIVSRKRSHISNARKKSTLPFYTAIRKYGAKAFIWDIIYQSKDQDHTLNVMEPYFIKEYNSYIDFENSNGYNATIGGCDNYGHSEQALDKITARATEQWQDPEYREMMLEYNRTKWHNPDFLNNRTKGWLITTPAGDLVTVINLAEYCREHNIDNATMCGVSKGTRDHHKGYRCKRIDLEVDH